MSERLGCQEVGAGVRVGMVELGATVGREEMMRTWTQIEAVEEEREGHI